MIYQHNIWILSCSYDEEIRTGKKIGSGNVEYIVSNTNIIQEKRANYTLTFEISAGRGKRLSVGKKLFGATNGSSWYIAIPVGPNARALYDVVRKRV